MIDLLMQWAGPALAGLVAFAALIYGPLKKRQGRREAETDAAKETVKRVEKGRKAVRDGRDAGTPADRLRQNDGRW